MYPLVDPTLKNDKERMDRHATWFKQEKTSMFLTEEGEGDWEANIDFVEGTV